MLCHVMNVVVASAWFFQLHCISTGLTGIASHVSVQCKLKAQSHGQLSCHAVCGLHHDEAPHTAQKHIFPAKHTAGFAPMVQAMFLLQYQRCFLGLQEACQQARMMASNSLLSRW
jgi:hypothetical protein